MQKKLDELSRNEFADYLVDESGSAYSVYKQAIINLYLGGQDFLNTKITKFGLVFMKVSGKNMFKLKILFFKLQYQIHFLYLCTW